MAGHVNGSIGVKVAHPDRTVVVGCGDGCYSLSGFELMTAVEHEIPVIWIIFNDQEFKLIKLYQIAVYGRPGSSSSRTRTSPRTPGVRRGRLPGGDAGGIRGRVPERSRPEADPIDVKISRLAIPHYSPSPDWYRDRGVDHGPLARRLRHIAIVFGSGRTVFRDEPGFIPGKPAGGLLHAQSGPGAENTQRSR